MNRLTDETITSALKCFERAEAEPTDIKRAMLRDVAMRDVCTSALLELQARRKQDAIAVEMLGALKQASSMWDDSEFLGGAQDDDNPAKSWRLAIQRAEEAGYGK